MNNRKFFTVFAVCFSFLVFGTAAFAFECVAPEGSNCLACHESSDIHGFHFSELGLTDNPADCMLCHCGDSGTSNCEDVPSYGPVETACCVSCHTECAILENHIPGPGNCASCHIGAPENTGIDDDCDGICNPGITDISCTGSDNCSAAPNGPELGTCTSGVIGRTCVSDDLCGDGGLCSMSQDDNYPPGGNGLGDVCECEGDFDCDGDQDGSDAAVFKLHFGRSQFSNPCTYDNPCYGDFDADGDADGSDASNFKQDFGRSGFSNPCPPCNRPVGVLFAVHGGLKTMDSNEGLWNSGIQQFSYDPNHSVYKLVIWNPALWWMALQEESTGKFVGKYNFAYPQIGGTDPFESITVEQFTEMKTELDNNPYGINFEAEWTGWMCADCVDHLPWPRFIYYGPDGPDVGNNCTYCGEDEVDRVVLGFNNGSDEFNPGATLTGQTSGATAVIDEVTLETGSWAGNDAAGFLSLSSTSARTVKFQDGEAIEDDGISPGFANAVGATRWPNCDPDRFDVDGSVERLLKKGVSRIIMIDLVMSGERFGKTHNIKEMSQKMLDNWKTEYGVTIPLLWVNDYSDLMGRSYPTLPEGWTRSVGLPDVDSEILLNGSPNPVNNDPDLALIWKDALEAAWNPSVSDANTGVVILNHALHDNNEVFDPKIDDTIVLNQNIKDLILDAHPGMNPDNFIGGRFGIKEFNPAETTHGKIERTRNMRGEDLGHQWMYESDKEPPPSSWDYLSWDALEYLKNQGVEHIVVGFTHIISASALDLVEIPNQVAREIGTKTWLKDPLNGGSWDFTHYPTAGHPFADYWGIWVDQKCGEWELQFDNGTDEIEMNPDQRVTITSATGSALMKEIILTSGTWGSDAAGTIILKDLEGYFADDQIIEAYKGANPVLIGTAQANGTETQTISTDCCFDLEGCAPDPLPRPYPPPRLTPIHVRASDFDPSLAYDVSDYGHLGYDPNPLANDQYTGTWQMYSTPDGDDRVGELLAKHVLNAIVKPMVYLSNGEKESVTEGESVTFTPTVVTGGTAPYTYEWSSNKDDAGWTTQGTGSSWTFNTTGGDAGTYEVRCVATDSLSETGEVIWNDFIVSP